MLVTQYSCLGYVCKCDCFVSAPGSPVYGINTTDVTSTSISLAWREPVKAYGDILQYTINYTCESSDCACEGGVREVNCSLESPCTSADIDGLNKYWDYTFDISAQNSVASSESAPYRESTSADGGSRSFYVLKP